MNNLINEHAQAWIDALRSGKYKQDKGGALCIITDCGCYYSALGVAEDLAGTSYITIFCHDNDEYVRAYTGQQETQPYYRSGYLLHSITRTSLGLTSEGERIISWRNDSGHSFAEIADCLEETPEDFFKPLDERPTQEA